VGKVARSRNIKPGFFRNEDLVQLPYEARLLFAGLWCLADREGRLEDRPFQIKLEIFPVDGVDINALLNALASRRLIIRYSIDGGRYIWIPKFKDHQSPHPKEPESKIPAFSRDAVELHDEPCNYTASNGNSVASHADSLLSDSPILIPDSLIPESKHLSSPTARKGSDPYTPDFESFWNLYPRKIEKRKAFKCWLSRIKEGYCPEQMVASAEHYAEQCKMLNTEPNYIKHAATFLGPSKPFEDYVEGVPLSATPRASPKTNQDRNREILLASMREDKPDGE
jgi:hypothetical protein